jgi:glucosamine--fructose-6-phosphate aminotransferase (isomerizing)
MCGVIGLICEKNRDDLGRVAAELLKTLEYRGYDSTGAALQGPGTEVWLAKGVGAPSVMAHQLGIDERSGQILCGQVRWATFGAVDDLNAQPHVVHCKVQLYGAHNGNVTNCDALQAWLRAEGHEVLSDNDGEMVVHTVEHLFAQELGRQPAEQRGESALRRSCMRAAIVRAAAKLQGSYAAVIVDPVSRCLWAIKQGSSLYFGLGRDAPGGRFAIASSDLASVLKLTRVVVPLVEGELVEFDAAGWKVWSAADHDAPAAKGTVRRLAGEPCERSPVRSRLRAKDTALVPPFETFMDQEISAQEQTCRQVVTLFRGGSEAAQLLRPVLRNALAEDLRDLCERLEALREEVDDERLRAALHALAEHETVQRIAAAVPADAARRLTAGSAERLGARMASAEAAFLADLLPMARDDRDRLILLLADALLELDEVDEYAAAVERFCTLCLGALERGGHIYAVCCGSSFHAAKAGALFFNEVARTELIPILPGEFRGQYSRSLRDGDMFVAISQSGETKDLIDVIDDVRASGRDVRIAALVNNVSSTLAQEKSDLVLPLRCGPEIAVPATKSFINQLVVLYCLALRLAERRLENRTDDAAKRADDAAVQHRRATLDGLPALIRETFDSTDAAIEQAAQLLYLRPSIHILATRLSAVAKEGALKVREVVLNHTEGFEGSEFKHGPNTILGLNTIFGPAEVDALLGAVGRTVRDVLTKAAAAGLGPDSAQRLVEAAGEAVFHPASRSFALVPEERALLENTLHRPELLAELYSDYPLIYLTGPDERDVALTVSQINTHKIRGATTVVVAEDHPALRGTASKAPSDNPHYRWVYVALPRTGDTLLTVFSATVVLQRLALKMSLRKAAYLDHLGIPDHGVHPDVPKNVSKSITVD